MSSREVTWRRLLAEGAVIVASVLLALAADAAWQGHLDRLEERTLLLGLRSEFQDNRARMQEERAAIEEAMEALVRLARPSADDPNQAAYSWSEIVAPIIRTYSIHLSGGFLSAVLNSGKLDLIRDAELRAALAETSSIEEGADEVQTWVQNFAQQGATALLRHPAVAELQTSPLSNSERTLSRAAVMELRSDSDLIAIVVSKLTYWRGYLTEADSLQAHVDLVLRSLDQALSDS